MICAQIEQEIAELEDDEKRFLEDMGLSESGLEKLIKASYRLLGAYQLLTAGEDETRAWTIRVGNQKRRRRQGEKFIRILKEVYQGGGCQL